MIVTNRGLRNGKYDEAILRQIKELCSGWIIRYEFIDRDDKAFLLGFKLKDIDYYV